MLSTVAIDAVTPRGGGTGTTIVISGSGFGVPAGQVVLDPEGGSGGPLYAAISSWNDTTIGVTVPAGLATNRTVSLQVVIAGGGDGVVIPFWVPYSTPGPGDSLDYQYPVWEAGPQQDIDDPRIFSAADFNRMLDRLLSFGVAPVPTTRRVDTTAPLTGGGDLSADRTIEFSDAAPNEVLVGPISGVPAPPSFRVLVAADIPAAARLKTDSYPPPTAGQTVFLLTASPGDPAQVWLRVNGVWYGVSEGAITVGGAGNQTVTFIPGVAGFTLAPSDSVQVIYV